ncbi:ParB N-terminal domain-containing protein [Candidatus Bathyarchaeota archaeon]|nr:ParB N-terminal domain-containing protein [Candidatus Bathyarchaeota archaeon]
MNETVSPPKTAGKVEFDTVPTESILANQRGNPRKNIRQRDIDKLCESIMTCGGILVPLIVFQSPEVGKYFLLDGERRLIAAKKLGLERVPVNILPITLSDDQNLATMFTIHMERVPWNTMARAIALNEYLELKPGLENDKRQLRRTTGMSPNEINNALLIRMFPKQVQLRAVFPERPGGFEPSYLIELAKVILKAEDLGFSKISQRPKTIEKIVAKIGSKLINDPYQLKDFGCILSGVQKKEAKSLFQKLIEDPNFGLKSVLPMYADKIQSLRSLHFRAAKSSIPDTIISITAQWKSLLVSLQALKEEEIPRENLAEIKKLLGRTRSVVKTLTKRAETLK